MKKTIQLCSDVPSDYDGQRLDQVLAKLFSEYSRSQLKQWVISGYVTINDKIANKPREKVHSNDTITINATLEPKEDSQAQAIPLNIIHEDDDLLIINKPVGLVVHPGAGNPDNTLVNALVHHDAQLANVPRAGIVHRLDKSTTGLLLVAKTLTTHHALVDALAMRDIKREYQAIVRGVMVAGGTVDAAIGRHTTLRKQMAVKDTGKPAVTHYRVLERFRAHTLIKCELDTGRTHQIRVHMAHIHYPIVGDPVYGKRHSPIKGITAQLQQALEHFNRQALHAFRLSFVHPGSGKVVSYEAPLPDDMKQLLQLLEKDNQQNNANE